MGDRFNQDVNRACATKYLGYLNPLWPPAAQYALSTLNLTAYEPALAGPWHETLSQLRFAVDFEWLRVKRDGLPPRGRFTETADLLAALKVVRQHLIEDGDREALDLRMQAIASGYTDAMLQSMAQIREDISVVTAPISTWYGKEVAGLPTAFACKRNGSQQQLVDSAMSELDAVGELVSRLHTELRLGDVPAFSATDLFFMAGEGNLHPKHIAYFLPEDEGVKSSRFKKTYYFVNTHRAILRHISAPLARKYMDIGVTFDPEDARFDDLPTLGVLAHELGHFVARPGTSYRALNAADRWASVTFQEVAADVFGALIVAEAWAQPLGIRSEDMIAYYLAECLRYTDRGLGSFPDSDGMALQLTYFLKIGALELRNDDHPVLVGDPESVMAALRSLARVLADALLTGHAEPALALHRSLLGPEGRELLRPLTEALSRGPMKSVEYQQDSFNQQFAAATQL